FGAGARAGFDDLVDREIALRRLWRADRNRRIGHCDMQRVFVGLGIDRDGGDPHAPRGPDDPAGDLAAIGDQDALEYPALASNGPWLCGARVEKSMYAKAGRKSGGRLNSELAGVYSSAARGRRSVWLASHARTTSSTSGAIRVTCQSARRSA